MRNCFLLGIFHPLCCAGAASNTFSKEELDGFRKLFEAADANGDMTIDAQELVDILKKNGEDITMDKAKSMIEEVDLDKNGSIDYDEFLQVVHCAFTQAVVVVVNSCVYSFLGDEKHEGETELLVRPVFLFSFSKHREV